MTGTIKKLVSDRRFGFIHAANGQDVFFHASAVSGGADFNNLTVGQEVEFDLERSDKGPRAVNVHLSQAQHLS